MHPGVKTILILAANPEGTAQLRLDREVREIDAGLRRSHQRNQFQLEQRWATRPRDMRRALLDVKPQIVHFCGHGEGASGLVLEDEIGQPKPVSTEALSGLFQLFADQVECVLLNACYAEVQANAIVEHIDYVIGMRQAVRDDLAIAFAVGFYSGLGTGLAIEQAFERGREAIQLANSGASLGDRKLIPVGPFAEQFTIEEHLNPVLKMRK